MKRYAPVRTSRATAAFSLIEMIGVLAIMAIMASVLVPNVLRSMDRAAVQAEAETLKALGEQVKVFVRENGVLPNTTAPVFTAQRTVDLTRPSWCRDIATVSDIAPTDLAVNRRAMVRTYLQDPDATKQRVLVISSMLSDPAYFLPTPAEINTAVEFQGIWDTPDGALPTVNWSRRAQWMALHDGGGRFLIERVDLRPIYREELASFTIRLNNRGASAVAFDFLPPVGAGGSNTIGAGGGTDVVLRPKARLNLYRDNSRSSASLDYTYIVGTAPRTLTFSFDGTNWSPQ